MEPPSYHAEVPSVDPPPYEMVIDHPNYADVPPPPEYDAPFLQGFSEKEEIFGEELPELPNIHLGFVDFLPSKLENSCDYQDFKTLMVIVNDWLAHNVHYHVINCECIDRPIDKQGRVESDVTIRMKGMYSNTSFLRGIRLWLRPNTENKPAQRIWYMNVLPKPVPQDVYQAQYIGMSMGRYRRGLMAGAIAAQMNPGETAVIPTGMGMMKVAKFTMYPGFEDLDDTLNKLNEKLKTEPIPGTILNTSCINMSYAENYWDPLIYDPFTKPYDPDKSEWRIKSKKNMLYLQVLRIFYVQESTTQSVEIGLQDFEAEVIEEGTRRGMTMSNDKYETHSDVMKRACHWIASHPELKITNINTVRCMHTMFGGMNPRRTSYYSGYGSELFRNVIRVAYVKPGKNDCDVSTVCRKAFIPARYQSRKSEKLNTLRAKHLST